MPKLCYARARQDTFLAKVSQALNGQNVDISKEEADAAAIALSDDRNHENIIGRVLSEK